jgi:hypothetical protein
MELARVSITLSGDLGNVVYKNGVTVPEASILRAMHGKGSVSIVYIESMDKRSHDGEYSRLIAKYPKEVITKLWPGENPRLPVRFSEIGLAEPELEVRPLASTQKDKETE